MCGDDNQRAKSQDVKLKSMPSWAYVLQRPIKISREDLSLADEDLGGFSSYYQRLVVSDDNKVRPFVIASTLVHELLHAAWSVANLKDGDKEEDVVTAFEAAIVGFVTDPRNEEIISWITEYLDGKV